MTHSRRRRFHGDGVMLCADEHGPPNGLPVLFFHGGGQSRRSWNSAARMVGAAGYRGLSFDLRGHGESGWAEDGDYMLDAFARDVAALIDGFDEPVVLVGASRGGQAALVGASRRPGRVAMVMLADVAPLLRDSGVDEFRGFFRASMGGFSTLDEAADALATHLDRPRTADASRLAKTMRTGEDGRLYWQWDPKTVSPEFLNPPSETIALEEAAARIKDPVILVRAEFSNIVSDASVDLFRRLTPQLEVIEAKGVGHMITGDRNDAFAETLLDRLGRHAQIGGRPDPR
ncbi:alpha/beta hydrolase [Sphingomonas sp. CGMCC 1.13654]|uniref:Alpha/beta hydrolase n=2 Tax=Sphingomonas chungangi TaxID=2683589 RepID=A0A838L2E0_9SPHN|nr:alpha/beta hydrolase [Sphingomonas chungangi]MVW54995.1 alpha/beta fold hydrolase [Sphingomonas chungangi]